MIDKNLFLYSETGAPKGELFALSPLDGRYCNQVKELSDFFSEAALIKYRLRVESIYLLRLLEFVKP